MKQSRKATSAHIDAGKQEIMTRFVAATSLMIRFGSWNIFSAPRPDAMFMAGPILGEHGWEALADKAEELDMEIVCLEFGADVAAGPSNISVFEDLGDRTAHWGKCALWSRAENDTAVILPDGCNFAFGYDGKRLVRITNAPTSNLAEGFERARRQLREMAAQVPSRKFGSPVRNTPE